MNVDILQNSSVETVQSSVPLCIHNSDMYNSIQGAEVGERRVLFIDDFSKADTSPIEWLFPLLCVLTISIGIAAGIIAGTIPEVKKVVTTTIQNITTEFHFTEPPKIPEPIDVKPAMPKEKPPVTESKEPVDMTKASSDKHREEFLPPEPPAPTQKKVRKVFGLRRVYANGLGSGGSMAGAVVAKIGNTINKEYDTLTVTKEDIRGTVVSAVSITKAPQFKKVVKPKYTKDMIDQKVEGTVKVKVLVDIDGKVKKATCLNDIGFGSASEAIKAALQIVFDPGMQNAQPVAVWIIVPITFTLLG